MLSELLHYNILKISINIYTYIYIYLTVYKTELII